MQSIRYSYQIFTTSYFLDRFSKKSNMKFYEKPSSGSRVVGWGQADMKKLNVAFRKIICVCILCSVVRTVDQRHIDALSK